MEISAFWSKVKQRSIGEKAAVLNGVVSKDFTEEMTCE
jgi:hypothetical protein